MTSTDQLTISTIRALITEAVSAAYENGSAQAVRSHAYTITHNDAAAVDALRADAAAKAEADRAAFTAALEALEALAAR